MKIAELVKIGKISYREVPKPHAGPGEIVLKIQAVGLCGTDVKAYFKGHPYFAPPCILGHEFTGTIVEVGPEVDRFDGGERVVVAPYVECGVCDLCQHGLGEMCKHKAFVSGAFQEFILVPRAIVEQGTFRLETDVDFSVGSLAEPLACVHNGIDKAGVSKGDAVLVIGGGPMGVMLALLARTKGAQVLLSEISASRIEAARRLGLEVVSPQEESLVERMITVLGRDKADRILVAVGSKTVVETAFDMATPGGRVLLFGGLPKGDRVCIDAFAVHYNEISLAGSFGYNLRQFEEAVRWLTNHAQDLSGIITHTVAFSEIERGMQLAKEAKGLKIVVDFAKEAEL